MKAFKNGIKIRILIDQKSITKYNKPYYDKLENITEIVFKFKI